MENYNKQDARRAQLEKVARQWPRQYGQGDKVLYVGGHLRFGRNMQMFDFFKGAQMDVIEIHPANIEQLERFPGIRKLIMADITTFQPQDIYDAVCWWHGPEHVSKEGFVLAMQGIKKYCQGLVLCATPNGKYEQGPEYGNKHERHLTHYYLEDWLRFGWNADAAGEPDAKNGNIIAWTMAQDISIRKLWIPL